MTLNYAPWESVLSKAKGSRKFTSFLSKYLLAAIMYYFIDVSQIYIFVYNQTYKKLYWLINIKELE
jgi:NADH:ubiquinone oxidoreductase subunit 3 (subunit A)